MPVVSGTAQTRPAWPSWDVEQVATIGGWPSGIAVSSTGRCFVALPQANGQALISTVLEIIDGEGRPLEAASFTSVQGLRSEGDRLYALDTGSKELSGCDPDLAALWVVDLVTGAIEHRFGFDDTTLFPTSYLNDLTVDAQHGVAYLVDSGGLPPNALIVLDLNSGRARRVLDDHETLRADLPATPRAYRVEGVSLITDPESFSVGVSAAAHSPDGKFVYWTKPDTLCCAPAAIMRDDTISADELDAAITRWPPRDFAADGIDRDEQGRIVLTDVTNSAVARFDPATGEYERLAADRRISWPDGVAVAPDGSIYVTASQIHRSPMFAGADRRSPPWRVMRLIPPT
jgi:sugar lactone lactonase YvrE